MNKARRAGLLLLLLGWALFILIGYGLERNSRVAMADFKPIYYASRCLLERCDPYAQPQVQKVYFAEGEESAGEKRLLRNNVTWAYYPPTAYVFAAPFALMGWNAGHAAWMFLTGGFFLLASLLMWELGSEFAPTASGALLCVFLSGQGLLLEVGNAAGVVVSLCAIAVWCFLRQRFVAIGIVCLAVSLAVKPHDSGLVWLYFLLAGGVLRKRALQTLLVCLLLAAPAVAWMHHVSPHWGEEMRMNLAVNSAPGGNNDPVGSSSDPRAHAAMTVYLQAAISVFKNDPHIYNLTSYLICGTLLLIWGGWTFYQRASSANSLLALAAVSALTMLPTYHRQHDTSLLVLAVPACALLWAQGGMVARAALSITTACALLTSNLVLQFLGYLTMPLWFRGAGLSRAIWTVLLARPATLALLALGCFYLWVYVRNSFHLRSGVKLEDNSVAALVTSA